MGPPNEVLQKDLEGIFLETMTSLQDTFLSSSGKEGWVIVGRVALLTPLVHCQGAIFTKNLDKETTLNSFGDKLEGWQACHDGAYLNCLNQRFAIWWSVGHGVGC